MLCSIEALVNLAGLFARTRPAQRMMAELESSVLSKVPAYEYLKQAVASVMGLGETADHPVVFAQLGGAWRIAVQTGVVGGGLIAIFLPNSPNPRSGSVFLVAADSVRPAKVPLVTAIACLRRCGAGSEAFLSEFAPSLRQAEDDKAYPSEMDKRPHCDNVRDPSWCGQLASTQLDRPRP